MHNLLTNQTFVVYTIAALVLCANLLGLWAFSGFARAKTKTAINEEDAVPGKATLMTDHPAPVARVLRAHTNAQAAIVPFLALGLIDVLAGGSATSAMIIFGVFTTARLAHTFVYLAGKQPWRTICFVIGLVATVALMGNIIWLLVQS
jgi:glutathione S-transferase